MLHQKLKIIDSNAMSFCKETAVGKFYSTMQCLMK